MSFILHIYSLDGGISEHQRQLDRINAINIKLKFALKYL